jgi:CheY-like chemotaxis protein
MTTVLLVEDEWIVSGMMREALTGEGFAVTAVESGDRALQYLAEGHAVDILFTDINLPGDVDGAALAEAARRMRPDLPIVYASGRMSASEIAPLVPRSVFVSKPYNVDDICRLMRRLAPTRH